MPWSLLRALIDTTRPTWRLVLVVVLLVLIWLALRQADRIASAVNLWMLAKDRQAACEEALHGKTLRQREQGLAVLDCLKAESPERIREARAATCQAGEGPEVTAVTEHRCRRGGVWSSAT